MTPLRKRFSVMTIAIFSSIAAQRNPFEFADDQLKKYVPVKMVKEQESMQKQQAWKIIETQHERTHIVEDAEGHVRSISLGLKN